MFIELQINAQLVLFSIDHFLMCSHVQHFFAYALLLVTFI